MSKKISLQKEQLIKLSQAYTDAEIAKMYNVSEGTIIYYRNKWEILRMPRKRKRKMSSDEKLRELYETCTPAEIAEMYGCTRTTVYNNLLRLGLSRYYRLPTDNEFKELYFKYSRKELAEMFGVHVVTVDYRAKQLGIYRDERHPEPPSGAPSKCPDKETLLSLLNKHSIEEIAAMYDVAACTAYKWCLSCGFKKNKLSALSPEEFIKLWQNHTDKEIADLYNTSKSAVYRYRQKYNITRQKTPRQKTPRQKIAKREGCNKRFPKNSLKNHSKLSQRKKQLKSIMFL